MTCPRCHGLKDLSTKMSRQNIPQKVKHAPPQGQEAGGRRTAHRSRQPGRKEDTYDLYDDIKARNSSSTLG